MGISIGYDLEHGLWVNCQISAFGRVLRDTNLENGKLKIKFLLKAHYSYVKIINKGMKFSLGKPKPHFMLMTSAKLRRDYQLF